MLENPTIMHHTTAPAGWVSWELGAGRREERGFKRLIL
jgi:hypothetical protein